MSQRGSPRVSLSKKKREVDRSSCFSFFGFLRNIFILSPRARARAEDLPYFSLTSFTIFLLFLVSFLLYQRRFDGLHLRGWLQCTPPPPVRPERRAIRWPRIHNAVGLTGEENTFVLIDHELQVFLNGVLLKPHSWIYYREITVRWANLKITFHSLAAERIEFVTNKLDYIYEIYLLGNFFK